MAGFLAGAESMSEAQSRAENHRIGLEVGMQLEIRE